ncbi:MAG TPA: CBS domain-containing protein [Acidimicrobiia bacterium]|nr:CBS domain-containing protein [Acidimicrobiia bacterium]
MTTSIVSIGPEAPLKEAARRMIEAGVSGLPVTTGEGDLIGVITEADFVKSEAGRREEKRNRLLGWLFDRDRMPEGEKTVADVMTAEVISLPPTADHVDAARLMERAKIKRIPVVDEGRLVGVVSRRDILRAFTRPDSEVIKELRDHVMRKVLWIDSSAIRITCADGNLHLSGRLETRSDAQLLAEFARRIDGVASVKDDLTWEVDNTKMEMAFPPSPRNWI